MKIVRKLLLIGAVLLCSKLGHAAIDSVNAPVSVTNSAVTLSSSTLAAQTGGKQNCINNASLMSTTVANMVIIDGALNGGTTIWQMISVPANTPVYPIGIPVIPFTGGGEINALCGGANSPLVVAISSGTKSINYQSFIRK